MQNSLRHKKGSGDNYHGNAPPTPTLTDALQSEVARLMEENLALREMMEKGGSPGRSPQGRSIIGSNSKCVCRCACMRTHARVHMCAICVCSSSQHSTSFKVLTHMHTWRHVISGYDSEFHQIWQVQMLV